MVELASTSLLPPASAVLRVDFFDGEDHRPGHRHRAAVLGVHKMQSMVADRGASRCIEISALSLSRENF
jgi:hypothetical protein